jgi:Tfp pilus assembly protein PilF
MEQLEKVLFEAAVEHHGAGRARAAEELLRRVLETRPDHTGALTHLGLIVARGDNPAEAAGLFARALASDPDHVPAHINLGNLHQRQARYDEAIACYHRVLEIEPAMALVHSNLASAQRKAGRLKEAVASLRKAIGLEPGSADAHYNLGNTLKEQGRLNEAIVHYEIAVELSPDDAELHWNLSLALLTAGDYERGWGEYEWRWKYANFPGKARHYPQPPWDGSDLRGETIFLYPEQGYGDIFQFVRYVPLLAAKGARVVLECPGELHRLFQSLKGVDVLVAEGDDPGLFACHAPLLNLPRLMGTTLETVPRDVPYLSPPPALAAPWKERVGTVHGRKVGLVWAGNPDQGNNRNRSMDASALEPLVDTPGISFFSLQVGDGGEPTRNVTDFAPHLTDFAETAAAIGALDLVICVDSAVAHLAGALGGPVWTMLCFDADWRYLKGRDDTPWYPTMRLFRQPEPGAWGPVIEHIISELAIGAPGTI